MFPTKALGRMRAARSDRIGAAESANCRLRFVNPPAGVRSFIRHPLQQHLATRHAKISRKPDGLAASVHEYFGSCAHGVIYTSW